MVSVYAPPVNGKVGDSLQPSILIKAVKIEKLFSITEVWVVHVILLRDR